MNKKNIALIFIAVGIVLVLFGGYKLLNSKKENNMPIENKDEDITPTESEAISIIDDKLQEIMSLFETPKDIFSVAEETEIDSVLRIKVNNYDEVINKLYTSNGIKQLENMKYDKDLYVLKNETGVYLLSKLPDNKYHSKEQKTIASIGIEKNSIICNITYSKSYVKETGDIQVSSNIIKLELKYSNKVWLIENFNYSY